MASIQCKKTKTGKKIYYVVVSAGGKHKWLKAGTQVDARKMKRQVESLQASELFEKLGLSKEQVRIDDFFQQFIDHTRLHNSAATSRRYIRVVNTFLVFLKMFHPRNRLLDQIGQDHIESYKRERIESLDLKTAADGEGKGIHTNKKLPLPQTVNYEINVLRSAFIWAMDRDLLSEVPTRKVKKLKPVALNKPRILSTDNCKIFLSTAERLSTTDPRFLVYFRSFKFMLNTGLRSGELCNLMWDDINLDIGLIKIQPKPDWSPKTYTREFFLNDTCVSLLDSIEDKSGYIFKNRLGEKLDPDRLRRGLARITKAAGFPEFTRVHDLRHTFNSLMQMNGVDPATMGKILGHRDIETTMIYTHQTQEHLKKSIGKIDIR